MGAYPPSGDHLLLPEIACLLDQSRTAKYLYLVSYYRLGYRQTRGFWVLRPCLLRWLSAALSDT